MVLVFILLGIIIIWAGISLLFIMSSIKIKTENLYINNLKLNSEYKISIQLYLLNKIKYFSFDINKNKLNKITTKMNFDNFNKMDMIKPKEIIEVITKLKIDLEKLNLYVNIGIDDSCVLSYGVAAISSIISIVLPYITTNNQNIKYQIIPEYNKNILNIHLESIISIKIVHIIYVIYSLVKKGSKKNERTSNRRAYAYSYE